MQRLIDEYQQLASHYDRRFDRYNAKTIAATLPYLGSPQDKTIVDIGCGTGLLLKQIETHYPGTHLYGIDLVPDMLAIATQKLSKNTTLIEASASHLPLRTHLADIVVSTNALHYFPDQALAIKEMWRLLKPGGRLVLTDWCADYFSNRLTDRWLRLRGKGHFHMLTSSELLQQLEHLKITNPSLERYKINWWWGMMTVTMDKSATD
jgi:ubiquinone/menaquinone biosynthesis C-methylase UbiE